LLTVDLFVNRSTGYKPVGPI